MAVITISRHFGSGGELVARLVAEKMGYLLINKAKIADNMRSIGILEPEMAYFDEKNIKFQEGALDREMERRRRRYLDGLHEFFYDLAIRENLVILGRGGQLLFRDFPPALHVKIFAPLQSRLERVCRLYNLNEAAAARLISEQDRDREAYLRQVFGCDWLDPGLYHLIINTGITGPEEAAVLIVTAARLKESAGEIPAKDLEERLLQQEAPVEITGLTTGVVHDAGGTTPDFAHPSEAEFACMLDFYRIKWLYEPITFPLEWDSEGTVTEAFTPDFYLPEHNLYLELTTQKQKLVWKKNKKIRRLREIYPDVQVKIIYGRDFRGLLKKYGIEEKGE
ncbi:MAG: cytidylate kinase family protein [Bacillota bacterium]